MGNRTFTKEEFTKGEKAELGDTVELTNQQPEVVACQQTGVLMLNIDADQLAVGDLSFIKSLGLTISNPNTDKPIALGVDYKENSWGHRIKDYLERDNDDDDSGFFTSSVGTGTFLGGMGSTGFGGFGGGPSFGGGGFGGGGASRSF